MDHALSAALLSSEASGWEFVCRQITELLFLRQPVASVFELLFCSPETDLA
jgi:hypothetical protein